jgi:hypothetical protein
MKRKLTEVDQELARYIVPFFDCTFDSSACKLVDIRKGDAGTLQEHARRFYPTCERVEDVPEKFLRTRDGTPCRVFLHFEKYYHVFRIYDTYKIFLMPLDRITQLYEKPTDYDFLLRSVIGAAQVDYEYLFWRGCVPSNFPYSVQVLRACADYYRTYDEYYLKKSGDMPACLEFIQGPLLRAGLVERDPAGVFLPIARTHHEDTCGYRGKSKNYLLACAFPSRALVVGAVRHPKQELRARARGARCVHIRTHPSVHTLRAPGTLLVAYDERAQEKIPSASVLLRECTRACVQGVRVCVLMFATLEKLEAAGCAHPVYKDLTRAQALFMYLENKTGLRDAEFYVSAVGSR